MRNVTRLLVLALAAAPASLPAQKKDDLVSIQRDISDLEEKVRQLQKSQDEKNAALTALVQQSVDASGKVSASLVTLQKNLTDAINSSLNDQQTKLVAPVAELRTKVEEVSQEMGALRETVADLSSKFSKFGDQLKDIFTAVTTPPVAPPAAVVPPPAPQANGAPPGTTAVGLRQDAERDFNGARYELALQDYASFIKYFPDSEFAPTAQYHIGEIYFRNEQWEDAATAFDKVLQFPKNEQTVHATYFKAVSLQKAGHKPEARALYKEFLSDYPSSEHAHQARINLATLEPPAAKPGRKSKQ